MREITFQYVEEVVMSTPKYKAPKPNGFTTYFFEAYLPFQGPKILELVEEFINIIFVLPTLNATVGG